MVMYLAVCGKSARILAEAGPDHGNRVRIKQLPSADDVESLLAESDAESYYFDAVVSSGTPVGESHADLLGRFREVWPEAACFVYDDRSPADDASAHYEFVERARGPDALLSAVEASVADRRQATYPLPTDERERLDALSNYDHDRIADENPLDDVTAAAARLLGADHAFAAFIDADWMTCVSTYNRTALPTNRCDSICTYTILDSEPLVVEDVTGHPRFGDNAALSTAGVRSYAGAQVTSPDGRTVGTLCVYGPDPRSFSERGLATLDRLAATASDLLATYWDAPARSVVEYTVGDCADVPPSTAVIEAVADIGGWDSVGMPQLLSEATEPDALDKLLSGPGDASVEFTFCDWVVTATSDGHITLRRDGDEGEPLAGDEACADSRQPLDVVLGDADRSESGGAQ